MGVIIQDMRYFIQTFGCQMNESESERIAAAMEKKGYQPAKKIEDADLVVINTCSVRQSAEDRVLGLVNNLKNLKIRKLGNLKIILTGCMLYHSRKGLKRKLPGVDQFVPIKELTAGIEPKRKEKLHAWVVIMKGCNQFCAYCVVPYARGREKSRPFDEVVCEAETLAKRGYRHITLLGQNVNSYGRDFSPSEKKRIAEAENLNNIYYYSDGLFALLLQRLHQIEKIKKISFITSNPWDLTDEIIEAMKLPKIDRYLHLPIQSGDNQILKRMNRLYTVQEYIKLVKKIRRQIPGIKIGTDIIVGFPGESKAAFKNTVKLCKKIGFEKAYIAKYSPRPKTAASRMKDNISNQEKKRRWRILDSLINRSEAQR